MILQQPYYFNPNQIPGLILWLDATDPAANGTLPSNGSSLATWMDKSGKGNNVSQLTGAVQPIFNTNIRNGLPAISFSGSQYIDGVFATLSTNPDLSIYLTFKSNVASGSGNPIAFGFGSSNNVYESLGVGQNGDYYNNFVWGGYESRYTPNSTTWHYLSSTVNSGTNISNIWIDANVQTSTSGAALTLNTDKNFRVGWMRRADGLFVAKWNGYISEVNVFSVVHTTQERLLMQNYIKNKWGF